jgi:hypothetical protein
MGVKMTGGRSSKVDSCLLKLDSELSLWASAAGAGWVSWASWASLEPECMEETCERASG